MNWFENLFGQPEGKSFRENRELFEYKNSSTVLTSKRNGRRFHVGPFETLSNFQLKEKLIVQKNNNVRHELEENITFEHISGDVRTLLKESSNSGAVFQVASQFNCLEMIGPYVTPEKGITIYCSDPTQGPACALACPAATVFRNYFVGGSGQGNNHQIDLLSDVGQLLQNQRFKYWNMKNGYCLPCSKDSMALLTEKLQQNDILMEKCYSAMRIGIHWDTEVTVRDQSKTMGNERMEQRVCQVFCSALPVGYAKSTKSKDWSMFARLVLDAAYDSTLTAAHILALQRCSRVKVYLTGLGAGAFENRLGWVVSAIQKAVNKHHNAPLDVKLVHFCGIIPSEFQKIRVHYNKVGSSLNTAQAGITCCNADLKSDCDPTVMDENQSTSTIHIESNHNDKSQMTSEADEATIESPTKEKTLSEWPDTSTTDQNLADGLPVELLKTELEKNQPADSAESNVCSIQ